MLSAFLVLALVSSASAAMIKPVISSLNGVPISPVSEITIKPSDTINFDIVLDPIGFPTGRKLMAMDALLSVEAQGPGTLDMSQPTWAYTEMNLITPIVVGKQYEVVSIAFNGMAAGIVVDHLLLHYDARGNVIISVGPSFGQGGSFLDDGQTEYPINLIISITVNNSRLFVDVIPAKLVPAKAGSRNPNVQIQIGLP